MNRQLNLMQVDVIRSVEVNSGHVSDPFSVIRALGTAFVRLKEALKMDLWLKTMDEMRDDRLLGPLLLLWWTLLHALPLYTWPFMWQLFLALFATQLSKLHQTQMQGLRLFADEEKASEEAVDVVKEAVKASLRLMQLTESFNHIASQIEKAKYILCLENWPLRLAYLSFISVYILYLLT